MLKVLFHFCYTSNRYFVRKEKMKVPIAVTCELCTKQPASVKMLYPCTMLICKDCADDLLKAARLKWMKQEFSDSFNRKEN